jgi:hypothetical protein
MPLTPWENYMNGINLILINKIYKIIKIWWIT